MLLCGPGVSVTTRRERNKKGEVNQSDEQKLSVSIYHSAGTVELLHTNTNIRTDLTNTLEIHSLEEVRYSPTDEDIHSSNVFQTVFVLCSTIPYAMILTAVYARGLFTIIAFSIERKRGFAAAG